MAKNEIKCMSKHALLEAADRELPLAPAQRILPTVMNGHVQSFPQEQCRALVIDTTRQVSRSPSMKRMLQQT